MGPRITRLQPVGGFAAETGAAITLFYTSQVGALFYLLQWLSMRRQGVPNPPSSD